MKRIHIVGQFASKKGHTVVVRYPQQEDADGMLVFANDLSREDTFVQLSGEILTREEEKEYLKNTLAAIRKNQKIQLVATIDGIVAANCGIDIDKMRKKHVGTIHISVAKPFREEGIGRKLLEILIDESRKKGLRLLTLTCLENNNRAVHLYESMGFQKSGIIPGAILYHGSYIGEVQMFLPITQ